ncbi:transmembrane protein 45A-like [Salvia hispanica]|uniref:transmembrane protein 45A-like n=1 Tax=Salvia hispanica TaxID=49212 RepID=UPI0020099A6D|nr:transmembrane protein 45A-like [Salvia hispanica]
MGSLRGHIGPGLAFFIIGLWHLFNHTKLHATNPNTYISHPWFPIYKFRYLELYFIIFAASTSISMELFIMPHRHHPFAPDGSIPSNHLHNLEHATISLTFLTYASFAVILDRISPPARSALTHLLGALTLAQELLLFRLHSTDHAGLEGRYHWLLQILILAALALTVISTADPRSFLLSFARSLAIFAQGVWLVVIGVMLYTPRLMPKGCAVGVEDGHYVVLCGSGEAVERAKSLATILFSYYVVGVAVFGVGSYLYLLKLYSKDQVEYHNLEDATDDFGDHKGEEH